MRITGLILFAFLAACSNKFEAFKSPKGVVPLQKSGCANFNEEWCGPELISLDGSGAGVSFRVVRP